MADSYSPQPGKRPDTTEARPQSLRALLLRLRYGANTLLVRSVRGARRLIVRLLLRIFHIRMLRGIARELLYANPRLGYWGRKLWRSLATGIETSAGPPSSGLWTQLKASALEALRRFVSVGWVRHMVKGLLRNHPGLWVKATRLQRKIMTIPDPALPVVRIDVAGDLPEPAEAILQMLRNRMNALRADARS